VSVGVYKRGAAFPAEQFVQESIEAHFASRGYRLEKSKHTDLVCSHPNTGDRWHVEAKGISTAIGLDFRTGLGQLVQRMTDRTTKHGIAVPDIPQFQLQISQMSQWAIDRLGVHWLIVREDRSVEVISPHMNVLAKTPRPCPRADSNRSG
jgi:hypothetical protein